MRHRIVILLVAILVTVSGVGLLQFETAFAKDVLISGGSTGVCSDPGAAESAACSERGETDNPITGKGGALEKVTNIVAFIAGAAAIIILIAGAIRYITSGGDSNKVSTAKNMVFNSIIGLVVIVLARTLVIFIVQKLS